MWLESWELDWGNHPILCRFVCRPVVCVFVLWEDADHLSNCCFCLFLCVSFYVGGGCGIYGLDGAFQIVGVDCSNNEYRSTWPCNGIRAQGFSHHWVLRTRICRSRRKRITAFSGTMPFFGSDHVWWSNLTGAAVFWSSAFTHGLGIPNLTKQWKEITEGFLLAWSIWALLCAVVPLRNQALVRNNAHLAKEIITARQQNAKMKKDLAHKDLVAWAWHVWKGHKWVWQVWP